MEALKGSYEYLFALIVSMPWSKNLYDEKDGPDQILVGANDPNFCVLLALGIHLETWLGCKSADDKFLFGLCETPECSKDYVGRILRDEILAGVTFKPDKTGALGSHSIRKLASSQAANNLCSDVEISQRGHWKLGGKKMVHTYIDSTLPYPDAKVAGELALGGPVKYVLKKGCGVSNDWITKHVCPDIYRVFGPKVSQVLGLALLWAVMDPELKLYLPDCLVDKVTEEYSSIMVLDEYVNPIQNISLNITGHDGHLVIDEFCEMSTEDAIPGDLVDTCSRSAKTLYKESKQMAAIYSKVQHLDRSHDEVLCSLDSRFTNLQSQLCKLDNNIKRIGIVPFATKTKNNVVTLDENNVDESSDKNTASYKYTLSKKPKTLNDVWHEYEYGIGDRVPAKYFTPTQRGNVSKTYYQRNLVWKIILKLINKGHSAEAACAKIYDVYGQSLSVSAIIKKMQVDHKLGGHPDLWT